MDVDDCGHALPCSRLSTAHSQHTPCTSSLDWLVFHLHSLCKLCSSFPGQDYEGGTASSSWSALPSAVYQTAGTGFGKVTRSLSLHQKYRSPSADPARKPTPFQNSSPENQEAQQGFTVSDHLQTSILTPSPLKGMEDRETDLVLNGLA